MHRSDSPSRLLLLALSVLFSSFLLPAGVFAQDRSQTVVLDVERKTISPGDPTINLKSEPSVVIDVRSADNNCKVTLYPAFFKPEPPPAAIADLREAARLLKEHPLGDLSTNSQVRQENTQLSAKASQKYAEGVKPSDAEQAKRLLFKAAQSNDAEEHPVGRRAVLNFEIGEKNLATKLPNVNQFKVTLQSKPQFDYLVDVNLSDESGAVCSKKEVFQIVIHVERVPFEFASSGGFALTGLKNKQYTLQEDPADTTQKETKVIASNGTEGIPSSVGAFVHYCYSKSSVRFLCWTSGVGTNLPSTGITLFLGGSIRLRPLQVGNSFFLNVGAVYGPYSALSGAYYEGQIVPATLQVAGLTSTHYKVSWFVALSYAFLDTAGKFQGVYSGNGQPSAKIEGSPTAGERNEN